MKKILYLDCASGISGDMFAAALLDLKLCDGRQVLDELRALNVDGFELEVSPTRSYGLAALNFDVKLEEHHHHHEHGHEEDSGHHHHHHEHRHLADIFAIFDRSGMSSGARELAKRIFTIVAEAEGKAHGLPVEQVHFHEVGAVDSIVDIAAAAILMDKIAPDAVVIREISEGSGFVHCQHGELPVPVPAVVNIAAAHALPLRFTDAKGEMVTPTGAAIAAAIRTADRLPERYTVAAVGLGAGKRDFGRPNILRAMLLQVEEAEVPAEGNGIWVLESNLDDCTGEALGLTMERLFAAGARDVHFLPCFMKKNRPAQLLRVICDEALIGRLESVIFETTTTIGIRRSRWERTVMARESVTVESGYGPVAVKRCRHGELVRCYPEFEGVRAVAEASGVPYQTVFDAARCEAEKRER